MKRCSLCGEEKPLTEFGSFPSGRVHSWCGSCKASYSKEYNRSANGRAFARKRNLLAKFGITVERYDELLAQQGGGCAICGSPPLEKALAVDHDRSCCPGERSCGECIRGILCQNCNIGISMFKDDPDIMLAAIGYLIAASQNETATNIT